MDAALFKNSEFKRVLFINCVLMIFFILIVNVFMNIKVKELNENIINRDIGIIGNVLSKYPEAEKEIIPYFTTDVLNNNFKIGEEVAKKYGYDEMLPVNCITVMNEFNKSVKVGVNIVCGLLFLMCLTVITVAFIKIYKRINSLAEDVEKIVEGNFEVQLDDEKEGELSKLRFQFNQMARRLKNTIEDVKREKDFVKDMVADISHQFKTPLASIKMFNELLLNGASEDKESLQKFLEKSSEQIERMEWLIQTLLKISRLEADVINFDKRNNDICKTVDEVVNFIEVICKNKNQNLVVEKQWDSLLLFYDSEWLKEAIGNIIKNASDYTEQGKEIKVHVYEDSTTIKIDIKDSGVGIPKEDLPYIFKKFYRAKNSSKKGTGIGLSLANLIIEKHGGYIHVETIINVGSTFSIIFPKYLIK